MWNYVTGSSIGLHWSCSLHFCWGVCHGQEIRKLVRQVSQFLLKCRLHIAQICSNFGQCFCRRSPDVLQFLSPSLRSHHEQGHARTNAVLAPLANTCEYMRIRSNTPSQAQGAIGEHRGAWRPGAAWVARPGKPPGNLEAGGSGLVCHHGCSKTLSFEH